MRRGLVLLLIVSLLGALCVPAAASGDYATARTPIYDASEDQMTNILLTVSALDQHVIGADEWFSFNEVVGPRTAEAGFVRAVNGRGSKVTGGGVSQVATTMYLALLELGGVEFGELMFYGSRFTGGYVDDSAKAVVTDYDSDHDLGFTNRTGDALRLELWASESYLYCTVSRDTDGGMEFVASEGNWFVSRPDPAPVDKWQSVVIGSAMIASDNESDLLNNIGLAADSIYDTTLCAGDVFSFNEIVGPREERFGYKGATNGRGVSVIGGGVAQVASVVWLAVRDLDDITIVEKSTYGDRYSQSYVRSSADAILTDYKAGTDFAFRYDGEGSITIYTWLDGNMLCCDICRNN